MPIWNSEFMRYAYPAIFSGEPDGVTVMFPDVPEALTWGATRAEAWERAADALISALSIHVEENRPNPKPSPARGRDVVSVTALEATKLALHDAMLAACMSNRELADRLGLDEKAVRRLRDPLQRSATGAVEAALRCLGKRVEVTVLDTV
jgi:antitoxin HicB